MKMQSNPMLAHYTMKIARLFIAPLFLLLVASCVSQAARNPFDNVVWDEGTKPNFSILYLYLSDTKGYTDKVSLIKDHASAALSEAAKHQGQDFTIIFQIWPKDREKREAFGASIMFGKNQLRDFASASPSRAEEIISQQTITWASGDISKSNRSFVGRTPE
jgi:hypothetical protein